MSNDIEALAIKCGAYKYMQPNYVGADPAWRYTFKLPEIEAFVAALSQPQEAVAWGILSGGTFIDINTDLKSAESILKTFKESVFHEYNDAVNIPLYTAPPNYEALLKENERFRKALETIANDRVIDSQGRRLVLIAREAIASKGAT